MNRSLWIVLLIVVAWTGFLIGYSVSALTGVKAPTAGVAGAGGYRGAPEGPKAGAGGYGGPAGRTGGAAPRRDRDREGVED